MHDHPTTLTDEEFVALYPTTPNRELARMLGVSLVTIARRAHRLGVHKDPATRYGHLRFRGPHSAETRAKMSAAQKGRTCSDESRAKMSASRKGRIITPEWRAKISASNRGKPRPSNEKRRGVPLTEEHCAAISRGLKAYRARTRKGGIRPKPFSRYTREYCQWRKKCLERDAYTCQDCRRIFAPGQRGLHVHHMRPYAKHPEVRLDMGNGVTMCTACHRHHHAFVQVDDYERIERVPCACGCGELLYPISEGSKPRRYLRGHNMRGRRVSGETRRKISESLKGRPLTGRQREGVAAANRSQAKRAAVSAATKGRPSPRAGWKNTYLTQEQFVALWPTKSSRELAAMCHWSEANVCKWAKKLGLPPRYAKSNDATAD